MKFTFPSFLFISILVFLVGSKTAAQYAKEKITLPNGWSLTPAGKAFSIGDLPLNIAVTKDKKLAAITNNGQGIQSIYLFDIAKEKVIDSLDLPALWYGLCFTDDGRELYASGGNENKIWKFDIIEKKLVLTDSIVLGERWPGRISPTGLILDEKKKLLYVGTKENNSLYVISLFDKKIIKSLPLSGEIFSLVLSPDKKELYASCWGGEKVYVINTLNREFTDSIPTGSHPNDMVLSKSGKYLFVANAEDNSVSVINTKTRKTIEILDASLYPGSLTGSTTNSVALGDNDKDLFIANADNNCLAVFDVSNPGNSASKGFIPTGWYPTCVRIAGDKIIVSNGKGFDSYPNPKGPNPLKKTPHPKGRPSFENPTEPGYIGSLMKGTLSVITIPTEKLLAEYSRNSQSNSPYSKIKDSLSEGEYGNPIPQKVGDSSPIKYVFYVIKENRTYDQVLGDIPQGEGKMDLCLFGEEITPNQHALAKEFILFDNFYVDGEVSADGHNWTMGAYANDYLEKTWPTSYGRRGGDYDAEGMRKIANNKNGFLWDKAKKKNIAYRSYGEFVEHGKANIPVLENNFCKEYPGWDPSVKDVEREKIWERDFDKLLGEQALPQLNTVRFVNDHTEGLKLNKPTPQAHVADNDLAVGLMVEHLAKSSIWEQTLVVVVEDDAQNGADHIDAHRSTAYLAGGYVKRKFVDHTPYTTSSLLRTMELILGLEPMSQYDAGATPLWKCFNKQSLPSSFSHKLPSLNLNEKNTQASHWQKLSEGFDFTKEDRVPDRLLSEVVWRGVKGIDSPMPPIRKSAFVMQVDKDDD